MSTTTDPSLPILQTSGEATVDHSAEIKSDLKTSIQSAMTDLERGLEVDQKQGATAAAVATADEAVAQNGSAEAEAGNAAEPAAATADSTVMDTMAIGRSVKLNTFQERTITRNTILQTMHNGPARKRMHPSHIDRLSE